ncbi:MAG: hypothetical protein EX266_13215, partial [Rhodobacteraceae bacterium]
MKDPTLEDRIVSLVSEDPDFRELSVSTDVYCPFDALGAVRAELRHSNFLADILSPAKPHGFGDHFARAFVDLALSLTGDGEARLDLHLAEMSRIDVRREWRSIDLLLHLPMSQRDIVVVIEIKVDAAEGGDQLERYEAVAASAFPGANLKHIFLTPDGREASRESWASLCFASLVDTLESAPHNTSGDPVARNMLAAYCRMIRRHHM